MNTLATNLITTGQSDKAKQIMQKLLQKLSVRNYGIADTVDKYQAAVNLYNLNQGVDANLLANSATDFLGSELQYYSSLDAHSQQNSINEIQRIIGILEAFRKVADVNKQKSISKAKDEIYNSVEGKLFQHEQEFMILQQMELRPIMI